MRTRHLAFSVAALTILAACSAGNDVSSARSDELVSESGLMATPVGFVSKAGPCTLNVNGDVSHVVKKRVTESRLTAGGATHDVRIYVPSKFSARPRPVVLNWHGLGSDGPEQALVTRYEALAEREGFVVVHATGVPSPGISGNSWEVFDDQDPNRDDLAFADALIDHVLTNYCTDPNRVYSTGMSNGGFFTARLICERADVIAAGVSVAGTYHPDDCFPSRDVPYRAYHGTDDPVVPFDGVGSSLLLTINDPVFIAFITQVPPEEFSEFARGAGCSVSSTVATHKAVETTSYSVCNTSAPLEFLTLDGAGHSWPGVQNWQPYNPVINTSVSATEDGWDFMKQFSL